MERSGSRKETKRIIARLRSYLLVAAIIMSVMTFGAPAFAGLDEGAQSQLVVTYESNGGSPISPEFVAPSGGKVVFQHTPVRECYSFAGWYYDSSLTQAYSPSDVITKSLTLYAKWAISAGSA